MQTGAPAAGSAVCQACTDAVRHDCVQLHGPLHGLGAQGFAAVTGVLPASDRPAPQSGLRHVR